MVIFTGLKDVRVLKEPALFGKIIQLPAEVK
jgi:hypothetical protein